MNNEDLVNTLLSGDKDTFYKVLETYNKLLWVVVADVLNKIGTVEDIEECICDVYIGLWENPNAYNPQKGIFKTFITVTAKRKANERYRLLIKRNEKSHDNIIGPDDNERQGYGFEMIAYIPEQFEECSASIKNLFYKRAKSRQKASKKTKTRGTIIVVALIFISITVALFISETFRQFVFGKPEEDIVIDEEAPIDDSTPQVNTVSLMKLILDQEGNFTFDNGIFRHKNETDMDMFSIIGEDGSLHEVEGIPFTVELHSRVEGEFEYIFYCVDVGEKLIIIPSQQDVMAFVFLVDDEMSNFFACTDTGIYKIDSEAEAAILISSEEYNDVPYEDLFLKFSESRGYFLTWIGNPVLSPDGLWITFQSNRNDADSLPSFRESLWAVNTQTGEEKMIPVDNAYTQVPEGFLRSNLLLVRNVGGSIEAGINLSSVDLLTGTSQRVSLSNVPNASISAIGQSGLVAIQTYDDTGIRELIFNISREGSSDIAFEIEGNLHYVEFSPCGKRLAAVLRERRGGIADSVLIDTIVIINTSTGTVEATKELESVVYASALTWIGSERFLLIENTTVDGRIRESTVLYTIR